MGEEDETFSSSLQWWGRGEGAWDTYSGWWNSVGTVLAVVNRMPGCVIASAGKISGAAPPIPTAGPPMIPSVGLKLESIIELRASSSESRRIIWSPLSSCGYSILRGCLARYQGGIAVVVALR